MLDLLIIGAGLSGLSAALVAAQAGKSVRVVAKGLGSMHWSAATVDLLGYLPGAYEAAVVDPLAAIEKLPPAPPLPPDFARRSPGSAGICSSRVWPTQDCPISAQLNPATTCCCRRRSARRVRPILAPRAQIGGRLDGDDPMLIVGFSGMRDFYPALIAENLTKQGYAARYAHLPLDVITSRRRQQHRAVCPGHRRLAGLQPPGRCTGQARQTG